MLTTFKKHWREFKRCAPGERFRRLHDQRLESRRGRVMRAVYCAGGMALIALGLIMLVAPGPGTIVLAAGVAILAQESLLLARALDWLELQLRKLFARRKPAPDPSK